MKHNKCLLLLTLVGAMGLVACGGKNNSTSTSTSISSPTTDTSSSSATNYKSKLEKALEKDYSNMTVEVISVYDRGEMEEYYAEFYYNDYTIVYTPTVAELGYDPYTYFHDYNDLSYQYFNADRPNDPNSKPAWLNKGYTDTIDYSLSSIYFDMNVLLKEIDPDTAVYQGGMYIISIPEVVEQLNESVFYSFFFNNIEYVTLSVNNDGYLSQVIGLQEINNEDDYVKIIFEEIGTTTFTLPLPEAPNSENVMEYWEYKGWDGPWTESYVETITLTPKKELDGDVLNMEIEDVVQATYTFTPEDANQAKDWRLHSTNENVATISFDFDDELGRKQVKITAVAEGDAEVYIKARGQNGVDTGVESNHIKVHVSPIQDQNLEGIKYNLSFTGISSEGALGLKNSLNNNLPVSATTTKASLNSGNSELFGEKTTLLLDPNSNGTGPATVLFDFDDQQVSSISLYYGLYWPSDKSNKDIITTITLDTSNDGTNWTSIDIKDEILANISSENFKLLEKEFEPATMVRISLTSGFIGRNFRFSFSEVAFMANSNCNDHTDVPNIPVESIEISASQTTMKCGKQMTINYMINPNTATDQTLVWHSTNESVASFTSDNVLTASQTAGSTEIYAQATNGVESNRLTITVEAIPPVDNRLLGMWLGDDVTTRAKFTFTDTNVTVSLKTSSVDESFVLDYQDKDGNQYIFKDRNDNYVRTSYQDSNSIYVQAKLGEVYINRYTENYDVYRYIPATELTLSSDKVSLNVGETTSIAITFNPSNATGIGVNDEITWTANTSGVVEFNETTSKNQSLFVKAIGAGNVVITATNGEGISNSITLTVKEPVKVESIVLSTEDNSNEVEVNGTLQIVATVLGQNGDTPANSNLSWSSSDKNIATVNQNGLVTGIAASDDVVTITATAQDGSQVFGTFEVKVIGATSSIPSGLVGQWSGMDSTMGYDILITINDDGKLDLEIVDLDTLNFDFVSNNGNNYQFEDENGNVLIVTYDARYQDQAKFELNDGEMHEDYYITITAYDDYEKIG